MRVVAYVSDGVGEALVARASVERRSVSQTASLLLEAALGEGDPGVAGSAVPRGGVAAAGEAGLVADASSHADAGVATSASSPSPSALFEAPDPEPELPWLPSLQRRATKKDYEDPDFDPGDYK